MLNQAEEYDDVELVLIYHKVERRLKLFQPRIHLLLYILQVFFSLIELEYHVEVLGTELHYCFLDLSLTIF